MVEPMVHPAFWRFAAVVAGFLIAAALLAVVAFVALVKAVAPVEEEIDRMEAHQ